jgi:hypothetical protein
VCIGILALARKLRLDADGKSKEVFHLTRSLRPMVVESRTGKIMRK